MIYNLVFDQNNSKQENIVLVISRIDPIKNIEKALKLAKLLNENGVEKSMKIIGSLDLYYYDYYIHLKKLINEYDLKKYVDIEINASIDRLFYYMKKSKTYFHPRLGEQFGMSIVEVINAGLIPIVPNVGGQTEFVPSAYQYSSIQNAYDLIRSSFGVSDSERLNIFNSVKRFSISNYKKQFQLLVESIQSKLYESRIAY